MSVLSRNRIVFFACSTILAAQALFAGFPSARTAVRMTYDPKTTQTVLFGGETTTDRGTARIYKLAETWIWTGSRWVQRYTAHSPEARSAHAMVYDAARQQIVLFGGRSETADLNDTWAYKNGDWTQIQTPNSPTARSLPAMEYDPLRDRIVVFGGTSLPSNATTATPLYDTWEFDGTTWRNVATTGPEIVKPILVYDKARSQMLLLGSTTAGDVKMYRYNASNATWDAVTGTLPPCVNEAAAVFQEKEQSVVLMGGVCTTSATSDEVYRWDGTNWVKIASKVVADRMLGAAVTYDAARSMVLRFGGTLAFATPRAATWGFISDEWVQFSDAYLPGPRSLFGFSTDAQTGATYLLGGINDVDFYDDIWRYQNGQWTGISADNQPTGCLNPMASYDTDRKKMVVLCYDAATTYEFDGSTWTKLADLKTKPQARRFSAMVYDPTQKKTVLFGGYDETTARYQDRTWLWDGTAWAEQKNKKPTARSLASMWYDATQKKVIVYGGLGRPTPDDRIERYNDMWALDANGWTKMTITATPGYRYGAQIATDPRTGKVYLFGGMVYEPATATVAAKQYYANDLWVWDGSAWKKLDAQNPPAVRENGGFTFDPTRNEMVLFGGYGGSFFSDQWTYDIAANKWTVRNFSITRRRTTSAGGTSTTVADPTAVQAE